MVASWRSRSTRARVADDLDKSTAAGPTAVILDREAGGNLVAELLVSAEAGLHAAVRARFPRAHPRPRGRRHRRGARPRRCREIRTGPEGETKEGEQVEKEGEHGKVAHDAMLRVRTLLIHALSDGKRGMRMKS